MVPTTNNPAQRVMIMTIPSTGRMTFGFLKKIIKADDIRTHGITGIRNGNVDSSCQIATASAGIIRSDVNRSTTPNT